MSHPFSKHDNKHMFPTDAMYLGKVIIHQIHINIYLLFSTNLLSPATKYAIYNVGHT